MLLDSAERFQTVFISILMVKTSFIYLELALWLLIWKIPTNKNSFEVTITRSLASQFQTMENWLLLVSLEIILMWSFGILSLENKNSNSLNMIMKFQLFNFLMMIDSYLAAEIHLTNGYLFGILLTGNLSFICINKFSLKSQQILFLDVL